MKTNLFFIFFSAGLLMLPVQHVLGQIEFEPVGQLRYGYENNIFHAPDRLMDSLGNYIPKKDLILSDMFVDYGYNLGLQYKEKKHRIYVDQSLWGRYYTDHQNLNQYDLSLDLKYKYRFSGKLYGGISYGISKTKKIGTTILGDELMQRFSYFQNDLKLFVDFDVAAGSNLNFFAGWNNKYYDRENGVIPLDANNYGWGLKFNQIISDGQVKSSFYLLASYDIRTYNYVLSLDSGGGSDPAYPTRDWRYFGLDFGLNFDPAGIIELTPYYKFDRRIDTFENYYSYKSHEAGAKVYLKGEKISARLVPSYTVVNYDKKKAPDPNGPDPLLVYKYMDLDFQMNILLFRGIDMTFAFDTKNRNTNTLDESRTTRRGYNSYEVMAGFSFNPSQMFMDRKSERDDRK